MNILNFISTLGLGGLIGIFLKALVDRNLEKRRLLFESRVKAYAGLSGRLGNSFLELDIARESKALRVAQINSILSETYLIASKPLVKSLNDYVVILHKFHDALKAEDKVKSSKYHKELIKLASIVQDEMRKDVFVPPMKNKVPSVIE